MFRDLGEARTNLTFQLSVGVGDEGGEVGDRSVVDHVLGEFFSVLGDFSQGGCGDALQGQFRLLNADHQERNGVCIHNGLCKLVCVFGNAGEGPCC